MRKRHFALLSALLSILLFTTASCDDTIYDDELDCSTKIKFVFKKHRQALQSFSGQVTDVFDTTVGSVHLFVYDAESGDLVFEQYETTNRLKTASELNLGTGRERCYMTVDLKPGKYRLVAWCGLDGQDQNNAFSLGTTRAAYTECSVTIDAQTGQPVHQEKYESLYHGTVEKAEVPFNRATVIPLELTKNTNDIAVWVQHVSKTFEQDEYEVVYADANGTMKFEDNSMVNDNKLEYHAYTTSLLTTSTEYNGAMVEAGALVAHISTARLMEDHQNTARLEVRSKDGNTVFSIPFIKYLLEMQTFTSNGQYYLDCEDTYNCSFYLSGENELWTPYCIIINNWVKVPDQSDSIGGE